jgi:hypothetical protein
VEVGGGGRFKVTGVDSGVERGAVVEWERQSRGELERRRAFECERATGK